MASARRSSSRFKIAFDDFVAGAAGPVPLWQVLQVVQQAFGARLRIVADPEFRQALMRWQLTNAAAQVLSLHGGLDAIVASTSSQSVAMARLGAWAIRCIAQEHRAVRRWLWSASIFFSKRPWQNGPER